MAGDGATRLGARRHRVLGRFESVAWAVAVLLVGGWLTARGLAWSSVRRNLAAFHAAELVAS
ncbi:MAG TPA: hypothetical protein VFE93_15240, partial [Myxococcaceae bacterium]|nr:hypothetical protein [Myxococcaceae bacterium]